MTSQDNLRRTRQTLAGELTHDVPDLDGDLSFDLIVREAATHDFGHLIAELPLAVLRPGSVGDIARIIRWASRRELKVAPRGQGHSIYGRAQAGGGIVIDMSCLDTIHDIQVDRIVVDAGVTWNAIVTATLRRGLTPPVLTNYLNLSVGGTLSVGGIGGTTHRYGMQTDNVLELDVVTGTGEVFTCSPDKNSELFDAVRAGQGQFGVITRATIRLVEAPTHARRYTLSYPDLTLLVADQRALLSEGRTDHLQGSILYDPDVNGWRYQLDAAVFCSAESEPRDEKVLAGLADQRELAQLETVSYETYVRAFDRLEQLLRSTGDWFSPHPWWLSFLPNSTAEPTVREVLSELAPADIGTYGLVTFYPTTTTAIATPLVRLPDESVVFPFNIVRFPVDDQAGIRQLVRQNHALYRRILASGGVLYPVSGFPLNPGEWQHHFGPRWNHVVAAKERFDPMRLLTPGQGMF